ncbi:hypothetical protein Tco_0598731 [Tanacetum coccineum]
MKVPVDTTLADSIGIVAPLQACASSLRREKEGSKMGEVDINTLTMEQYLALTLGNGASSILKPEIGGNVNFEIKSQFMRELRAEHISETKVDDSHEHVERILDIVGLFNIPGITHDAVMLRILPIILTRATKRWVDRLPSGRINTWDLLKKDFIQRYC